MDRHSEYMPGGFPEKLAMMRRHGSGRGGPISEALIVTLGHGCFPMSLRRLVSDGEMSMALSTCVNSALKRLSQTGMYWGPGLYLNSSWIGGLGKGGGLT